MKGRILVIEGACDGIGKTTQYNKLFERLIEEGYEVVKHHFPSYNTFYGHPVEEYLKGTFGNVDDLNPYFINSLYANDRACTWYLRLKKEYDSGKIILLDRYTTSSLIYQSSMINDQEEKKEFINYVSNYEYNKLGIPYPDIVLFLTAPFDLINELRSKRTDYEGNSNDIHEKNIPFMKKVYDNSLFISNYLNWDTIKCNNNNEMKSIDEIHENIYAVVKKRLKQ